MGRRDGWGDWMGLIAAQPASKNNNKHDNKNKFETGKKSKNQKLSHTMKTIKISCSRKKSKIQKLSKTMKMIKIPLSFTHLRDLRGGGK
jgi:hypothetical protein